MKSKHIYSAHPGRFVFFGAICHVPNVCAVIWDPRQKLKYLLRVYEEVKKRVENENTGCCQCFPNDCSVVWHRSRCLLGLGPIHLCLGSSLSNAIWMSETIVSLMWQPKLGFFYLSPSGVKKEEERNITNTSWYVRTCVFSMRSSLQTGRPSRYLDAVWHLIWSIFNIC